MSRDETPGDEQTNLRIYKEQRKAHVKTSRNTADGNLAQFLNDRLNYQRKNNIPEAEDHSPWKNPEEALMETYFALRIWEVGMWTNRELIRIHKVMAAFFSLSYPHIIDDDIGFWKNSETGATQYFFDDLEKIVLDDEEIEALRVVLMRVGRSLDPTVRIFGKPIK